MSDSDVRLLIDGYNLLHASGVFPQAGPATFERARGTFLEWLEKRIEEKLRQRTIVVFDGMDAAPGMERRFAHAGMTVLFSRRKQSADEVLEELITAAAYPRQLIVVSSDHRVQRAARQRSVAFVDSEAWLAYESVTTAESDTDKPATIQNPFPAEYLHQIRKEL